MVNKLDKFILSVDLTGKPEGFSTSKCLQHSLITSKV